MTINMAYGPAVAKVVSKDGEKSIQSLGLVHVPEGTELFPAQRIPKPLELREFEKWLNDRRMHDVSYVFHEIVAKYRAALLKGEDLG